MGELLLAKVFFKKYHSPIYIYIYKLCYPGYKISANYLLFLNIKLDRNETISIFVAHS